MVDRYTLSLLNDTRSHRLATLLKVTPVNTTVTPVLRFTDHNRTLKDKNDETYTPVGSFRSSARQKQVGLREQNTEFIGIITSSEIQDEHLFKGFYRDCQIDEYIVDWAYPWAGYLVQNRYWIDEVEFDGEVWRATVSGVTRKLRRENGEVYTRNCRYILGETRCGINFDDSFNSKNFKSGTLTVSSDITDARTGPFGSSLFGFDDNWFDHGFIEWTGGSNNGFFSEVKLQTTDKFTLHLPTPYDVENGDTFVAYAGCDKRLATCRDKFNNLENHGGFPYIPGTDRVFQQGASFGG